MQKEQKLSMKNKNKAVGEMLSCLSHPVHRESIKAIRKNTTGIQQRAAENVK